MSIRVAIVADSHFCEDSRFEECIRMHDWIANDIAARELDLVLHAGDVFEKRSTPAERRAVADWLTKVASSAAVVVVRGNHDAVGDLGGIFGRLATTFPIVIEEACGVHVVPVCDDPDPDPYGYGRTGPPVNVAVGCVAWPRKAELLARLATTGTQPSQEDSGRVAAEALRGVLLGLGAEMAQHDGPKILLAHAMVRGSITSTGQPLMGCDMEISLEDLGLSKADFIAIGHIHASQSWTWNGVPIAYPGSPRRTAFGELEDKGYIVVTFERAGDGWACTWERVIAPATPMLLLEAEFAPEHVGLPGDVIVPAGLVMYPPGDVTGAEVRVRYRVASDERDAAKRAAGELKSELLAAGAVVVKLEEEVVATTRARAPEIALAVTLEEKLQAFWRVKAIEVSDERASRLFGRLHELENEYGSAA